MSGAPPFWRFLPGGPTPDAESVRTAGEAGKGSLARALREARETLGAHRAAAFLREARFGRPSTLLVVAPFQPRAIEDALRLAGAIAGIAVELRAVDGFAALAEALSGGSEDLFSGVDLALVPLLGRDAENIEELAEALARRCSAPVLIASPGEPGRFRARHGVEVARLSLDGSAVDDRFGATFGAIPTGEAAERIADAAAARAARIAGTAPKLLVTDLDGTLWSGTLAEDGASRIVPDLGYAGALKALADDGLLLAIASRNDPRDVDAVFAAQPDRPLSRNDFVAASIGWDDKDVLVASVLDRLGLGAEHIVFVDDDPVNCAKVAARFPDADVRLVTGDRREFAAALLGDPLLRQAGSTAGNRTEQYRRRDAVERLRGESADVGEFLRRLRTVLTIVPLDPTLFPRAAELASRVNQFALNGWRPSTADLGSRRSRLDFMVRLDDAFGSHGLVGLVLARAAAGTAKVDGFFLSCRALGRGVESAMLTALGELAREASCDSVQGTIDALPRNEPARRSFSRYLDAGSESRWTIRPEDVAAVPEGTTLQWARTTT